MGDFAPRIPSPVLRLLGPAAPTRHGAGGARRAASQRLAGPAATPTGNDTGCSATTVVTRSAAGRPDRRISRRLVLRGSVMATERGSFGAAAPFPGPENSS